MGAMRGRAEIRCFKDLGVRPGEHFRGFLITAVFYDPRPDMWVVILRGPGLPECVEGAVPWCFDGEEDFEQWLSGEYTGAKTARV